MVVCEECDAPYTRRQGNQRFCSPECGHQWHWHNRPYRGQGLNRELGSGCFYTNGSYPEFVLQINGKRYGQKLHRIIAQFAVKELLPYPPIEVHHIDGDKLNWKPSNLVICKTKEAHRILNTITQAIALGAVFPQHPEIRDAIWVDTLISDDVDKEEAAKWWLAERFKNENN